MAASVGFVCDRTFTDPAIAEVSLTADGGVIVVPVGCEDRQNPVCFGATTDRRANLGRLGMAARLSDAPWADVSQRVQARLGLQLGHSPDQDQG
jgi:hypothetical protein